MRATEQLSCHLGLDNVGQLTDAQFKPLTLGDLYLNQAGDTLPDNLQLYSVAEKLVNWWKGFLQTDVLHMAAAFKMRMQEYIPLANSILNNSCQSVEFTLNTPPYFPRKLQIKIWDKKDPDHALYLALNFPDEEFVAKMKEDNELWYPDWKNQLVFKNMCGIQFNGVVTCRVQHRWASYDATVIPDDAA